MDTVIKNINLRGKTDETIVRDLEDWINDTATKLNLMLNYGTAEEVKEESKKQASQNGKDYIVEQGESKEGLCQGSVEAGSICYYRMWNSGVLELWGQRKSQNVYVDVSTGTGYVSRLEYDGITSSKLCTWGTWPVPFVDNPAVSYRLTTGDRDEHSGDYEIIHSMHRWDTTSLIDTKTTSPSFAIRRESQKTYGHPVISFHAIGHWK